MAAGDDDGTFRDVRGPASHRHRRNFAARQHVTRPNRRSNGHREEAEMGKGILLWLLGIPLPIIIILLLIWH
jgi:hypothetical protein